MIPNADDLLIFALSVVAGFAAGCIILVAATMMGY